MPHLRPRGSRYTTLLPTLMLPCYLPAHLIPQPSPCTCFVAPIPHVNAMGHASPTREGPLRSLPSSPFRQEPAATRVSRQSYMDQAPPCHEASSLLTLPTHPHPLCPQCCHISSGNASLLPSRLSLLLPYGLERPEHQHLRLSSLLLRALQADQDAYPSPYFHLAQVYWRDSLVCS